MREYLTVGDLARLLGVQPHNVTYAISRYGPAPRRRIGILRVWHKDDIAKVRESLRTTGSSTQGHKRRGR